MLQKSITGEFNELHNHGMFAASMQYWNAREVLSQMLPGRNISVEIALRAICLSRPVDDFNQHGKEVADLVGALSNVGLNFVRKVPGLIMGQREARLYVQPRLLLRAYPHLAPSIPHPFKYSLVLDSEELQELECFHEGQSLVEDWPENNEFISHGWKGQAAAQIFEAALFAKLLPRAGISVESGIDKLCAGLSQESEMALKQCDSIHLEFEAIGARFHRIAPMGAPTQWRRGPRKGFLFVTNSDQLVRAYPDLAELLPYLHTMWPYGHIADCPAA
ncbi:hypothetical protein [Variovorax sp. J31P207]|uniref:hypothetical protein n=1 Tax=Variovorax sp. J31P207 TaxID=3053510 RepID=UPI00257492DF|nr:hypothetical protein [Variovorax sp. J31P207]MDM0068394.1 hypothetical protein [Variovorax sp. J31P207]